MGGNCSVDETETGAPVGDLDNVLIKWQGNRYSLDEAPAAAWEPASYGSRGARAFDPRIRGSLTVKDPQLALSHELKRRIDIYLTERIGLGGDSIYWILHIRDHARVHKYLPGAGFATHQDTPKHIQHVGNLILTWYSVDARGGHLIVEGAPRIDDTSAREQWLMVYMPLYVTHRVSELTAGVKYTVIFPIWNESLE